MCLYPKLIENRKYKANKKNKGKVPKAKNESVLWVPVGCGNCMECRTQKASGWKVRLKEELRHDNSGKFVTFTFSDESLNELHEAVLKERADFDKDVELGGYELDNRIATIGVRRFLERWRKKYKKSVKHWLVTELGGSGTERLHLHGILFTQESGEVISEKWKYGRIAIGHRKYDNGVERSKGSLGFVNERSINYMVKYLYKVDMKHKGYKSKMFVSPGIGKGYLERKDSERNRYNGKETVEEYRDRLGIKTGLPIYYRNKLYNDDEREMLWLYKLDEKVRWVGGARIDVSKSDKEYFERLEYVRNKSIRLGYGNGEIDWERKYYENQLRFLKHKERLNKK